jgi:hypothetical protein
MSRVAIGVRRLGSNSPIEEMTRSTTGSKSSEVEGKSPCGQVDLLLRDRLLTLKEKDAYHGH